MSNLDGAIRDYLGGQQVEASSQVIESADASPDNVVRAFDLSKATGVPAPVIYPDLENFDKQTKQGMSAAIVQSNNELMEYIRRNPLAAKLSNDDWAALDKSSMATSRLRGQATFGQSLGRSVDNTQKEFFSAAEAAGSLFGSRGLQELGKAGRLRNEGEANAYPPAAMITEVQSIGDFGQWVKESVGEFIPMVAPTVAGATGGAAVGAGLGLAGGPFAPITVPGGATVGALIGAFIPSWVQGTGAVQSAIKEKDEDIDAPGIAILGGTAIAALDTILPARIGSTLVKTIGKRAAEEVATKVLTKQVPESALRRTTTGVVQGIATEALTEAIQEGIEEAAAAYATNKPIEWEALKTQMIEAAAKGGLFGGVAGGGSAAVQGMIQAGAIEAAQRQNKAMEALEKVKPWVMEGVDPPLGVDPIIDQILEARSRDDLKSLQEAEKEAFGTATRERNPELFADFQRQHVGNQQIEINIAGIDALYGDKDPEPNDGLLGWDLDIAEKIAVAREGGVRVQIPLADWLAFVDPEVSKALHDFIALRSGGVTKFEKEEFSAAKKAGVRLAQIDAWHGSGAEFEAFDTKHIGSGEGAQAYAYGHYFAENQEVAKNYAAPGFFDRMDTVDGQRYNANDPWHVASKAFHIARKDGELASETLRSQASKLKDPMQGPEKQKLERAAELLEKNYGKEKNIPIFKAASNSSGVMYKARIKRKPEEFLDWETELDQQPAGQTILAKMDPAFKEALEGYLEMYDQQPELESLTGQQFHRLLEKFATEDEIPGVTQRDEPHYRREASEYIGSLGVAGVRFLDQQSRKAMNDPNSMDLRTPTRNYVVFNDADIEILTRNGDPVQQALETIRSASHLKRPIGSLALKKVAVKPEVAAEYATIPDAGVPHDFIFENQNGERVGQLSIEEKGDELHVDFIGGNFGHWSNSFGPALTRSLLRQLKIQFPNAKWLTGERVSGARQKADADTAVRIRLPLEGDETVLSSATKKFMAFVQGGEWVDIGDGISALVKPTEKYTAKQQEASAAIDEIIDRLAPHGVEVQKFVSFDNTSRGYYVDDASTFPLIQIALNQGDPEGTTRHEVIHFLRQRKFFTEPEWEVLRAAAIEGDWMGKHDIKKRYWYMDDDPEAQLEEAIADEFSLWAKDNAAVNPGVKSLFERFAELIRQIRERLVAIFGEEVAGPDGWKKLFAMVESGEVGSRDGDFQMEDISASKKAAVGPAQPELPGITRMEDRKPFAPAPPGMSVKRFDSYLRAMDKQHKRDYDKALERAKADEARRQRPEWKRNEADMRQEVTKDLDLRPDLVADEFLRTGVLYGEKVGGNHRIDPEFLTPEQRKALPERFLAEGAMHPEDVAALAGYPTVEQMITHVAALVDTRGDQLPAVFRRRLIAAETARRMEAKYGAFEANVLAEARDEAVSETQEIILHEQTLQMAEAAGQQFPISREALKAKAAEHFGRLPLGSVSYDGFMKEAGRAGRAVEAALLKADAKEAFREAQRQEFAILYAKEARKIEKAQASLAKTAKQFKAPKVKSVAQEYTNYIHQLLMAAGFKVRVDEGQVERGIAYAEAQQRRAKDTLERLSEQYTGTDQPLDPTNNRTLTEFVADRASYGLELQIPPDYNPSHQDAWSVNDFRTFKTAVDSLRKIGRLEQQILRAGELVDRAELVAEIRANLETLPVRTLKEDGDFLKTMLWRIDAPWTRVEEMLKDMDRRKDAGPIWSAIIPLASTAKHTEFKLLEEVSASIKDMRAFGKKWRQSLNDTIEQDFIYDTYYNRPFKLTRWNMIRLMMNWGNQSNREKMVQGIAQAQLPVGTKVAPEHLAQVQNQLKTLFDTNANKQDWEFTQRIWDVFAKWQPIADRVSRDVSGVGPKWIKAEAFDTPHGRFEGGYMPLIPDKSRSFVGPESPYTGEGPLGPDFIRATTTQTQYLDRTRAQYFVDISGGIENLVGRMQQTVHDLAFREFVVNTSKLLYDKEVKSLIQKHYGPEYYKSMLVWLDRVANDYTIDEKESQGWHDLLRQFRINLLAAALPLNYAVMFSPSVGTANLKRLVQFNIHPKANRERVMEKSKEIQHQIFNLDRDMTEQLRRVAGKQGWTETQMRWMQRFFAPLMKLEKQFRMVTFDTEYTKQLAQGRSDLEAAELADSKVRERHGSASVVDLPVMISTKNEWAKFSFLFMGFFIMHRNWSRQMPEQTRQRDFKGLFETLWGTVGVAFAFNALLFTKSPEDEPYWSFLSRALLQVPLAGVPIGRELFNYYSEGYRSTSPMFSAGANVGKVLRDMKNLWEGKEVKDPVKNLFGAAGAVAGVPGAIQIGRTADFLNDVRRGQQRPRDVVEFMRGVLTGEAEKRKR